MNLASHPLLRLCFIACLSFIAPIVAALPDDRQQPINVSADKARKNGDQGLTVYEGSVVITQGSIYIEGDKIAIYDNAGVVSKIIANGKPAIFKQRPEPESGEMIAKGETIEYDINTESLLLLENALLEQEGRTTNSNKITYDMKTTVVNAGDNNGRVIMVIPPSK